MMKSQVLILTRSAVDAEILTGVLGKTSGGPFTAVWLTRLDAGLRRLDKGDIDLILVDLTLADSSALSTFEQLYQRAPRIPILILSSAEEEQEAIEAVRRGAQGYLSKGYFSHNLIPQSLRSVIQRKKSEELLFKERSRAEATLNSISDAVIGTDSLGNVDYMNIASEKLTGWQLEEACGRPIADVFKIINGVTRQVERNTVALVLERNKSVDLPPNTVLIKKDGSEATIEDTAAPIHDRDGRITGATIVFHDVSHSEALNNRMEHLAQHDFLTNLPNRILLNDRIEQAIMLSRRRQRQLAVLFLDLDNFKHINDSLGHATGDKLLQSVARRLLECVRASDTVSRQGGDEFVILLDDGAFETDAALIAEKVRSALAAPHAIDGCDLYITTSIGISIYPSDGKNADALLKNADTAMYCAKDKGKNSYQFFRSEMNTRAVERQRVEGNLRRALERNEFIVEYQPKINLGSGKISGAEALLRWRHPSGEIIFPDQFVRIAEDCGLIVPIGRWVLREACIEAKKWADAGLRAMTVAVNISALEFRQIDFLDSVREALDDSALDVNLLQLEITEHVLMDNAESSAFILQELKTMGVQLAVDDFGTGYSSLSYLNMFALDVIKIDQSFVVGIDNSKTNGIIVGAVIGMGNNLRLKVIAEGIENVQQLNFLKALHCDEGQGFYFSKSISSDSFAAMIQSERASTTETAAPE